MIKSYTGIDIGSGEIKMTVCANGVIQKAAHIDLPRDLVKGGDIRSEAVMAAHLRDAGRKHRIKVKDAASAAPRGYLYVRRLDVPLMTAAQLDLNLPYEFRDFLTSDKDQYFFDYYIVKPPIEGDKTLDIMAAVVRKEVAQRYERILKRAGYRLRTFIPEELAYGNLIRHYAKRHPEEADRDYCIIDLGHDSTRVHLFRGDAFEVTRAIEIGGKDIDAAIAQALGIDLYEARLRKHENKDGVQGLPECLAVYSAISVEIMRAINFYGFNYPETSLEKAYLCGGGSKVGLLIRQIRESITPELEGIVRLMPDSARNIPDPFLYPVAVGLTLQ